MKQNFEDIAGLRMVVGVEGAEPSPAMIKRFQKIKPGGLILFRPNFRDVQTLRRLIEELEKAAGHPLIVAVDHEGGRVIHIPFGVTVFPDNLMLGMTKNETYARRQGEIEAGELKRLGIDLNLAPTIDVLAENFSPNIGIRSYGKDTELVSRLGAERIRGMQENGLSACAKHFPGLGSAPVDPHLDLPVLSAGWAEMEKTHLPPFKAVIAAGVDAVMTSHPVYPKLDSDQVPVTFSAKLTKELLREKLKFQGLILSDDLEMGALRNFGTIEDSAVRAVRAGHDMVLICHDIDAQARTWEYLVKAYEQNKLPHEELIQSTERIKRFNDKRKVRFEGVLRPGENSLAREIAREAVSMQKKTPLKKEDPVLVIFPKLSSLADKICIENEMMDEKEFLMERFILKGFPKPEILAVGLKLETEEIKRCLSAARQFKQVLFFCYDAHLDSGTQELLLSLQRIDTGLTVVFMRDPYDADYLKPGQPFLQAYGFRRVQLEAVLDRLW